MSDARGKTEKAMPLLPEPRPRLLIPAVLSPRLPAALVRLAKPARSTAHKFDKAFQVFIYSDHGVTNGVGRNISGEGMFIETREPCGIGQEIRVVFSSDDAGAEITAIAQVRFQCFLNFAGEGGETAGMRGIGVRFVRFEEGAATPASRAKIQ